MFDLLDATRCRSSPYKSAITRRFFAAPDLRKGPRPAIASETTSACARPELIIPSFTETTFATEPCDAMVETMRPDGPQAFAASHLVTPGGWLSTSDSRAPTGK